MTVSATASSGLPVSFTPSAASGVFLERHQQRHDHPAYRRDVHRRGRRGCQRHLQCGHPSEPNFQVIGVSFTKSIDMRVSIKCVALKPLVQAGTRFRYL